MARAREEGIDLVGPDGMLTKVTKSVLEAALGAELTEHLGYEPHDPAGRGSGNSRNGSTTKVVHTDVGPVTIEVPRDRDGSFSPVIVPKHFRRLEGFDEAVVSLYAKGLTTGEIQSHLEEIYGAEVSKDTVSRITDSVNAEATEWQNRPLDSVYPVIFIDAIVVKIRDGAVANRPIYVAMAVTMEGARDVLGLWVGTGGEGAKHWLNVLTELRNRGMNDVFIVCCDGLNGLPESVKSVWPLADVQTCVVHLVRNTLRYTTQNDWNKLTPALRAVYTAPTRDAATERFAEFEEVWGAKYPAVIRLWRNAWDEFVPFLAFPSEIRSLIYTTNAIESLNARFRRSTRIRGHFPNETAAIKILYLTIKSRDTKGGNAIGRVKNWKEMLNVLLLHYGDRINY
ncbi:MAG TPA: IS256 family transposase [Acidimicrobiales bacterium]|nr:IS256 family transposase [Acidimicrobiales bacterium]